MHVFRVIAGEIKHDMISIQYWLMYHPYYDSDCAMGRVIRNAQAEQISSSHLGVPVDDVMLEKGLIEGSCTDEDEFPRFYDNTTEYDASEALFVMNSPAVTKDDLKQWIIDQSEPVGTTDEVEFGTCSDMADDDDINDNTPSVVDGMALVKDDNYVVLSQGTKRLHREIDSAGADMTGPPSQELKMDAWKTMKDCYDLITQDKYCTGNDVMEYMNATIALRDQYFSNLSGRRGVPKTGGGYVLLKNSPVKGVTQREPRLKGLAG